MIFQDGVQCGTTQVDASTYDPGGQIQIGEIYGRYFHGYLNELRFNLGIARWTSGFAVPNKPYGSPPF
jgi:hypothetical protein